MPNPEFITQSPVCPAVIVCTEEDVDHPMETGFRLLVRTVQLEEEFPRPTTRSALQDEEKIS